MPLIPDDEAADLLARHQQLETIVASMMKTAAATTQISNVSTEIATEAAKLDALRVRLNAALERQNDHEDRLAALEA